MGNSLSRRRRISEKIRGIRKDAEATKSTAARTRTSVICFKNTHWILVRRTLTTVHTDLTTSQKGVWDLYKECNLLCSFETDDIVYLHPTRLFSESFSIDLDQPDTDIVGGLQLIPTVRSVNNLT